MKLEYRINLNDVSLKKLLASVLSVQIALWAVMGLNALGVSTPIIRPLIGFVYLMFVPGILILTALRLRNLAIVEIALYAVGLSVAIMYSIGLVANFAFPALNSTKPFSFLAVTSSVSSVVLFLCATAYFRNRTHYGYAPSSDKRWTYPKPPFTAKMSAPWAPTLFLCMLPFLAVFSTYLVNAYNVNAGQLLLWLLVCGVVLLIAFDKFIPSKLYPLAVFVIALCLLFQRTLISAWLTGADIQTEWSLANTILNTGVWNPNGSINQVVSMLSVVALAPIYSLISSLDLVWVFKVVYPIIFALVPVGLYQIFRRQLNQKVAFLSCFFFVAWSPFYILLTELARQEVAELFFVLLILLLVSKEMDRNIQSALFTIFGLSLVVSHYGLFYTAVFLFFMMWLVLTVARIVGSKQTLRHLRNKIGIHKDKPVSAPSPESPPNLVTIVTITVLFVASTAWYFYTAQGTITEQVILLGNHVAGSFGELFNPTYSQAANEIAKGPLPGILHRLNAYVTYLNVVFILAGVCLTVFFKKQRFKLQFSYIVFSVVALGLLITSVVVPYLGTALDWIRTYHITLIVLAPFLAIGFIKIGETAGVTMRKVTSKLGFGNSALVSCSRLIGLLAMYLVLFMLLSSSFLFAITEGYQNIALSNQADGAYSHQTIVGATWQVSNFGTIPLSGKSVTIYHYLNGVRYNDTTNTTDANGQIIHTQTFGSPGLYEYYATFTGDGTYQTSTSAVVYVTVVSSQDSGQDSNQATINVSGVAQTATTLSVSTTTPEVGQPVTFTATLRSPLVIYGDAYNQHLLRALGLEPHVEVLFYPRNQIANNSNIFLGTYNIENNKALLLSFEGVNAQYNYTDVTPLISNRSLIYSNGGASVYS